jgi:hypothetical protein
MCDTEVQVYPTSNEEKCGVQHGRERLGKGTEYNVYTHDNGVLKRTRSTVGKEAFTEDVTNQCLMGKSRIGPDILNAWWCGEDEDLEEGHGFVVQERMLGTLHSYLANNDLTLADGENLVKLVVQISLKGYIMDDMNPGNVMYDQDHVWYLVDQGTGFTLQENVNAIHERDNTFLLEHQTTWFIEAIVAMLTELRFHVQDFDGDGIHYIVEERETYQKILRDARSVSLKRKRIGARTAFSCA